VRREAYAVDEFEGGDDELDESWNPLVARSASYHWCYKTGGNYWTGAAIWDDNSRSAVAEGFDRLSYRGPFWNTHYTNSWPKRFWNYENIGTIPQYCGSQPWFEYPVLSSGEVFGSIHNDVTDPGPDRVIFDRCGNWCATITHRGEAGNGFHACDPYTTSS
jgi:hypothetical protein